MKNKLNNNDIYSLMQCCNLKIEQLYDTPWDEQSDIEYFLELKEKLNEMAD